MEEARKEATSYRALLQLRVCCAACVCDITFSMTMIACCSSFHQNGMLMCTYARTYVRMNFRTHSYSNV